MRKDIFIFLGSCLLGWTFSALFITHYPANQLSNEITFILGFLFLLIA